MPEFLISPQALIEKIGTAATPLLFDTCRHEAFAASERVIAGAKWRSHREVDAWAPEIPVGAEVVVNCLHGHQMSQSSVARLRARGVRARQLAGGIEAYIDAGGPTILKSDTLPAYYDGTTRWVTGSMPDGDAMAAAWFIRRFIDPTAEILFVHADWVKDAAKELDAVPFHTPDTEFGYDDEQSSVERLLKQFDVKDDALHRLARIVGSSGSAAAPESAGLRALSHGIRASSGNDQEAQSKGMVIYDALYAWCRNAVSEVQDGPTQATAR